MEESKADAPFLFQQDKLMRLLDHVIMTRNDVDIPAFSEAMLEFTKLFSHMGKSLAMAFSDITSKAQILQEHHTLHNGKGLMSIIQHEMAVKTAPLNGENNTKFSHVVDMKEFKSYTSAARTSLRLMWFMDYVYEFMSRVDQRRMENINDICRDAYDVALGPHHPFTIRAVAKVAMLAAPSGREKVFRTFYGDMKQDEVYKRIQELTEKLGIIRVNFWSFYQTHKLVDLP